MSNPIAKLFSHIKNAQKNQILVIEHPQSRVVLSVLGIMQECGYIRGYRVCSDGSTPYKQSPKIEILLKYKNRKPAISTITCISRPSRRVYVSAKQLFPSHSLSLNQGTTHSSGANGANGANTTADLSSLLFVKGILIITTSKGIMTHLTAYRSNVGGEILGHIS
jgi:small subunit ribosomal protein S8